MSRTLLLYFALLTAVSGRALAQSPAIDVAQPTPKSSSAAVSFSEDSAAENELLDAANHSRQLAGAPPLRVDETLRAAAREHARRMIATGKLDHQLPGEPTLLERVAAASPLPLDRAGENLAYATCAPGANDALMRSAPHRHNLLDAGFNVAGIAAFWSHGKLYVVQDFAHEVTRYSAAQADKLVGEAVAEIRQQASLAGLPQLRPHDLDAAACRLSSESHPNARLLATSYENRRIITYTQSHPDVLPPAALRLLKSADIQQFAVGSCYARNAAYPTGTYWVAILLY